MWSRTTSPRVSACERDGSVVHSAMSMNSTRAAIDCRRWCKTVFSRSESSASRTSPAPRYAGDPSPASPMAAGAPSATSAVMVVVSQISAMARRRLACGRDASTTTPPNAASTAPASPSSTRVRMERSASTSPAHPGPNAAAWPTPGSGVAGPTSTTSIPAGSAGRSRAPAPAPPASKGRQGRRACRTPRAPSTRTA